MYDEWLLREAKRLRDEAVEKELDELQVLAENGFVSKLLNKAFPSEEELELV